jgi:hypothetical protein
MYNTWGGNEVLPLKKISFHPKLVKIRTICLPGNIMCNTKREESKSLHSRWSILGFCHRSGTSELQYEPSGARLSLLIAEIRSINHETSLAVKDLKITVSLGKVDFSNKI